MKLIRQSIALLLAAVLLPGCASQYAGKNESSYGETTDSDTESETECDTSAESASTSVTESDTTETIPPTTELPTTATPETTEPETTEPPHTHSYVEGKTVEATCTAKGYTSYTCSTCGAIYKKYNSSAKGHSYGEWVTVEPTCRKTGSKTRKCTVCGKTEKKTLKKVDCCYDEATCDKPRICKWCKETDEGLPLFHKWDEGQWLTIDPSTGEGTKKYTCSVCGGTREVVIDKHLPSELTDNSVLRAMSWLGYDVNGQIANGDLYSVYGAFELSEKYRSKIFYDEKGVYGLEGNDTVSDPTSPTGKSPALDKFKKRGLICASFTTYYYLNYLPNVEGIDMSWMQQAFDRYISGGYHYRAVLTWDLAFKDLANQGKVTKIGTSAENVDRTKLATGDLVLFSSTDYRYSHVAIYLGSVRGEDYVVHCAYKRGVEINTLSAIADPYNDPEIPGASVYAIYHINGLDD